MNATVVMDDDLLPRINLTRAAVERWAALAHLMAKQYILWGFTRQDIASITEERATLRDGKMVLWVEARGMHCEMVLEPEEWEWQDRFSQVSAMN